MLYHLFGIHIPVCFLSLLQVSAYGTSIDVEVTLYFSNCCGKDLLIIMYSCSLVLKY